MDHFKTGTQDPQSTDMQPKSGGFDTPVAKQLASVGVAVEKKENKRLRGRSDEERRKEYKKAEGRMLGENN